MHPTELRRRVQRRAQAVQTTAGRRSNPGARARGLRLDASSAGPAAELLQAIVAEATAGTNARVWGHAAWSPRPC